MTITLVLAIILSTTLALLAMVKRVKDAFTSINYKITLTSLNPTFLHQRKAASLVLNIRLVLPRLVTKACTLSLLVVCIFIIQPDVFGCRQTVSLVNSTNRLV